MSYPTRSYSDYKKRLCALVGIPMAGLTPDEQDFFRQYFYGNYDEIYQRSDWTQVCKYSEARLVGSTIDYGTNFSSDHWNAGGLSSITANQLANPADARVTAGFFQETDVGINTHNLFPSGGGTGVVPNTNYQFSVFIRPGRRTFCRLFMGYSNIATAYTPFAYFNLTGNGAVVSTSDSTVTASIALAGNGFYLVAITTTSPIDALTCLTNLFLSNDGVNFVYAGTPGYGVYVWGWWLGQAQNFPANMLIPLDQAGESAIDTVFNVWRTNPLAASYPVPAGYTITQDGVQIIGGNDFYNWQSYPYFGFTQPLNGSLIFYPIVFIDYRPQQTDYASADAFDATATYTLNELMYYTNDAGVENYWAATATTAPTQTPDTNPELWAVQAIPDVFFKYIVYGSYADWLRQDGQAEKAEQADGNAEEQIATQFDVQERQNSNVTPWRVSTHITSQTRFY